MSKAENITIESQPSILRRSIIRGIISGEEKIEYLPKLLFGKKNDLKDINSAVFIFSEIDNTYSLQTDNFHGNIKEIVKGLIICTIENMPLGGLLFCGENIDKPSSVYFFCHPEIPEEFSTKAVIEKIEDQRELVRKMM